MKRHLPFSGLAFCGTAGRISIRRKTGCRCRPDQARLFRRGFEESIWKKA